MKLWTLATFCTISLLILSGCSKTPKPGEEITVDNTLPMVKLTKNGSYADMNAIAFEWESIEDERVKGIYIYKSSAKDEAKDGSDELELYKTIANRFSTHYLDTDIEPNSSYIYGFKTYSQNAESKMSKAKVINSLPVLQSVVWIKSIQNMPRSAKIIWRPHSNKKVKSYIVERSTLEDSEWKKMATIDGRLNAEFLDFDLKDEYVYKYRVRVVTYDNIISKPSEVVEVITKALPITVTNITATKKLPRRIEINWDKSTTEDFERYYLYRSDDSDGSYDLIAKLYNNTFTDKIDEDGKEYFYRVSAVEKNGLESIHDKVSVQGVTLIKPQTPSLVSTRLINSKIELKWNNKDKRVKSFTVIKTLKKGWFDKKVEEFTGISGTKFIDAEVGPDMLYYYQVCSVDEFGIKSKPSIVVEIKTPKNIKDGRKQATKHEQQTPKKSIEKHTNSDSNSEEIIIPTQDFN